ncbi:MAG TPA: hypothetical protein VGE92_09650 [Steroidobacteraceae bacterium]
MTRKLTETSNALAAANARIAALVDLNIQLAAAQDTEKVLQGMCAAASTSESDRRRRRW